MIREELGCCTMCFGSGSTHGGPCWDCRGSGHPHPPDRKCDEPTPAKTEEPT